HRQSVVHVVVGLLIESRQALANDIGAGERYEQHDHRRDTDGQTQPRSTQALPVVRRTSATTPVAATAVSRRKLAAAAVKCSRIPCNNRTQNSILPMSAWRGHSCPRVFLMSRRRRWIRLHRVIPRRPGNAVLIRPVVHNRRASTEIVMRWRRCRCPLQRGGFPRIVAGLFALLHAPE